MFHLPQFRPGGRQGTIDESGAAGKPSAVVNACGFPVLITFSESTRVADHTWRAGELLHVTGRLDRAGAAGAQ